jgi:hypothetical protein
MADQSQDFAISQGRAMTGRKNQLFDMAMGGANGLQYLQAARDFNQQQQYAKQDYALNRSRETRDFGIGMGRDTRNFGISQQRPGRTSVLLNKGPVRTFHSKPGKQPHHASLS